MSYLLDTHSLLWTLFDDTRLSTAAKAILLDGSLDIFARRRGWMGN
jgi:PIN domain nuclease of toxin-antitoxin system